MTNVENDDAKNLKLIRSEDEKWKVKW